MCFQPDRSIEFKKKKRNEFHFETYGLRANDYCRAITGSCPFGFYAIFASTVKFEYAEAAQESYSTFFLMLFRFTFDSIVLYISMECGAEQRHPVKYSWTVIRYFGSNNTRENKTKNSMGNISSD